jgi:hypothetical protein
MQSLLARLPPLGPWPRRLGVAGCLLLAAVSATGGSSPGLDRPTVPRGMVSAVVEVYASAAILVRAGDRVDLVDGGPAPSAFDNTAPAAPSVLAAGVRVLSVIRAHERFAAESTTSRLVIATDRPTALRLARNQGQRPLAVITLPP